MPSMVRALSRLSGFVTDCHFLVEDIVVDFFS